MRKSMCVLTTVAFVAVANADINLWLSETGITDPAQAFIKTTHDFMPVFDQTGGAPLTLPVAMGLCCDEPERVFFVWGEFTYPEEVWYEKLYGLHVVAKTIGCATLEDSVVYRHQGLSPKGVAQWTRWDGDLDLVMGQGCEGLPVPEALTANGIRYDYGIQGVPQTPQTYDMRIYDPVTYRTRFLIGAIRMKFNCTGETGELYVGLGTLGVRTDGGMAGGLFYPDVYYNGNLMQRDGVPPSTCQWILAAYEPEPASVLLMGLGSLLLRRR